MIKATIKKATKVKAMMVMCCLALVMAISSTAVMAVSFDFSNSPSPYATVNTSGLSEPAKVEPPPYTFTIPTEKMTLPRDAPYPVMFFPLNIEVEFVPPAPTGSQLQCTKLNLSAASEKARGIVGQDVILPKVLEKMVLQWNPTGCAESTNVVYAAKTANRTFVLTIEKAKYLFQPVLVAPAGMPDSKNLPPQIESIAVAPVRIADQLGLMAITNGDTSQLVWTVYNNAEWTFSLSGGTPTELMSLANTINKTLSWSRRITPSELDENNVVEIIVRQADGKGQTSTVQIGKQANGWFRDGKKLDAGTVAVALERARKLSFSHTAAASDEKGLDFYPAAGSMRLEFKLKDGSRYVLDVGMKVNVGGTGWFTVNDHYIKSSIAPVLATVSEFDLNTLMKAVNALVK